MLSSPPIPAERSITAQPVQSQDVDATRPLADLSDGQLLRNFLEGGEEAAFAQLVSRFGPLVLAVALRSLRDRHAAEDVFQATFLVLARDVRKIRSPDSVGAWLHGTALRISKNALARRPQERPLEDIMLADEDSQFDDISRQFEQQLVDEELQALPDVYRAPLVLHFLEGKTCEATAAALGTSVGAVRGRIQRGKRELKLRLMKRGIEVAAVAVAISMWQSVAESAVSARLISAATEGGIAMAQGTPFTSTCSSEAVHLATKETSMITTGKVLVSSAAILSTAALGWLTHAEVVGRELPRAQQSSISPEVVQAETAADHVVSAALVPIDVTAALALADADDDDSDAGEDSKPQLTLKYDDGKADGKKSIAGTGQMIQFTLPDKSQKLRSLRVHCARYGTPKPPDEDIEVTIISDDGTDIIHTEFVPYSTFKRGESRWTTIRFDESVEVPETFWVVLEFNAERTKGVYVSYDSSSDGKHSRTGVPGGEPKKLKFEGGWMIQAILDKPE